jgi:hypothetical protein
MGLQDPDEVSHAGLITTVREADTRVVIYIPAGKQDSPEQTGNRSHVAYSEGA